MGANPRWLKITIASALALAGGGCYVGINVGESGNEGAVRITGQPQAQTVVVGERASFTVDAVGATPMTCQWRRDGIELPGATGMAYTTPPLTLADDGTQFTVRVCNFWTCQTSTAALLSVIQR